MNSNNGNKTHLYSDTMFRQKVKGKLDRLDKRARGVQCFSTQYVPIKAEIKTGVLQDP
jgi:hypothetical protein